MIIATDPQITDYTKQTYKSIPKEILNTLSNQQY
jgi:hypothetical protein